MPGMVPEMGGGAHTIDVLAADYVRLALHLHNHDPNPYIYIGDKMLQEDIRNAKRPLADLDIAFHALRDRLKDIGGGGCAQSETRRGLLLDRADALITRSAILQGRCPDSFEGEVEALYSVTVLDYDEAHFRTLANELARVIPGTGPLPERMVAFREGFRIPPDTVEAVVVKTLEEAQMRTRAHLDLPDTEGVSLKMNNFGEFGAFAEYTGTGHTNVHFSTKMAFHVDRIVELATHEAYPGHHVQALLLEAELVKRRGWIEWTMLPLFGAHTIVAEGAANYGIGLSFSREERIAYDREVVLPMAGLAHLEGQLEDYHRYVDYVERLNYARNEATRRFLYQGWDRDKAVRWLMEFGLETREIAEQRLTLIAGYRSYVVTYNSGLDWVRGQIERDDAPNTAEKWQRLRALFETPVMPIRTNRKAKQSEIQASWAFAR